MLYALDWVDPQIYLEEQKMWVDIEFFLSLLSVEPISMMSQKKGKGRERQTLLKYLEKQEKILELYGNIVVVENK